MFFATSIELVPHEVFQVLMPLVFEVIKVIPLRLVRRFATI